MLDILRLLQIVLLVIYPIITHLAVYWHNPSLALIILSLLMLSYYPPKALKTSWKNALFIIAFITTIIVSVIYQTFILLYLPPIIISALLFYLFSKTLFANKEPIITSFARVIYKENSEEVKHYTRRVTQLWSLFFLAMLLETILLSLFASAKTWSLFCNIMNYFFIGLLFAGEGLYRKYRFKNIKIFLPLLNYFMRFGMKGINFNTLDKLPLISHTDLQNLFAFKNNQPITCLDFLSDVYFLAELLPKSKYIINLCEDRYKFSVLFSAALLCNRITLLPNNNSSQSLQQLQSEFTDSIIWRDNQIPDLIHQHDVNSNPLTIPSINKDQLVVILYTSGSTGKPIPWKKYWGELVQHSQLTAKALGLNLQEKLQIVTTVATQHMYGLEHAILLPMQMGYIINNLKPFFAGDLITIPSPVNYKTILFSTPLHLKLFAENSNRYPTLRLLVSATAHLTTELATSLEKKFKAILIEIYGCTEAGCIATRQTTQTNHWLLLSNYQLEQVVNNYYLLTPSLNTKKLNRIKLADHLQIIDSQHFILQGRRAENINIAGKRMSLADLNIKLNSIPGIEDGIFYCPTNKEETKRLMALVVAPTLSTSDIRKALRQMIDPVFLPRPLIKLNKLPRNDTGKLPVEAVNSILKEYTEVVENY